MSTDQHVPSVAVVAEPAAAGVRRRWIVSVRATRARRESVTAAPRQAGGGRAAGPGHGPKTPGALRPT